MHTDQNGVMVTDGGLAYRVVCGKGHSGNKTLARHGDGLFECQGCGSGYCADEVRTARAEAVAATVERECGEPIIGEVR